MTFSVLVIVFDINSILSDISIATLALFWLLFAWSLFPSFHFQSMHVLKSKVSLADSKSKKNYNPAGYGKKSHSQKDRQDEKAEGYVPDEGTR